MKVKDLVQVLATANPDAEVLIRLSGSIYPTAPVEETTDYNTDGPPDEYFIVTNEEWPS